MEVTAKIMCDIELALGIGNALGRTYSAKWRGAPVGYG